MIGCFPNAPKLKSFHSLGIKTQIMNGSCTAMSSLATFLYLFSFRAVLANFVSA